MRVAMVTPMSPESAIADVMTQAIPDLTVSWELDVWCPSETRYRSCPVPMFPFESVDDDVLRRLSEYDLVVYVLGNSAWHSRILPLARALPGLVVMHDASVTDLVRHTAIEHDEFDALIARVEAEHGAKTAVALRHAEYGDMDAWLRLCANLPLDDEALDGSLGVVVHSAWHARRVDGLSLGEVTVAPLPIPSARLGYDENDENDENRTREVLEALDPDAILLVTVGSVNANRRVDLLLEAVAADPRLVDRVHVWAVGPIEPAMAVSLNALARRLGLGGRLKLPGRVTDALLHDVLARADIAAALRDPVLEGQSASVFTQLLSGTPVIVYDHAHFAELPDDVAVKIALTNGATALAAALVHLVEDEQERVARGQRGRDFALSSRSGATYAAALLDAGERALSARPLVHVASDLGARIRRLGLQNHPVVVDALTDLAFELFDPAGEAL